MRQRRTCWSVSSGRVQDAKEDQVAPPAEPLQLEAAGAAPAAESAIDAIGTSTPVDDFQAMVEAGAAEQAVSGMQDVIRLLVDGSLNAKCAID